ncbi:hypothetical protein [Baekduia sp. Peel2402]|uniref:GspE/PulE/PilB domain-containing protein n=1 Tax=Baekduia sp. Peel2402 TaxID=3458296 RepID=UPI00403EDF68
MDDAVGIAFTAGLPFAGLRSFAPDPALLAGFPPGWLATRRLLPLSFVDGTLTLASAAPDPDLSGLDAALRIKLVISPAAEIARLLAAADAPPTPTPPPPPPREATRVEEPPAVTPLPRSAPPREAAPAPTPPAPVLAPMPAEPERDALAAVPEHLQRRLRCLPLALTGETIEIACADPLAPAAIDQLRHAIAPRTPRLLAVNPAALDERLVAIHGLRWVAAIRRGLPRAAKATAPASAATEPHTTLLLPLPGGVGPAVQAATTLAALDHPLQQLEVVLLVRAHDAQGARAARTTGHRVVIAPASLPDGRLALLDLGLLLARGDHVAVLDPGDIPAPRLFHHADAALAAEGVAAARVHAPPNAAEDTPTPKRRGLRRAATPPPAPLPATGVVVRRDVLDAVGGWRDLAAKLHEAQLRVVTLDDAVAAAERS